MPGSDSAEKEKRSGSRYVFLGDGGFPGIPYSIRLRIHCLGHVALAGIGDSTAGLRFGDVTIYLFSRIVMALCFVQGKATTRGPGRILSTSSRSP